MGLLGTSKTAKSSPRPTLKIRQAPVPATRVTITGATTYESVPDPLAAASPTPGKKRRQSPTQEALFQQPDCAVSSEHYATNEEPLPQPSQEQSDSKQRPRLTQKKKRHHTKHANSLLGTFKVNELVRRNNNLSAAGTMHPVSTTTQQSTERTAARKQDSMSTRYGGAESHRGTANCQSGSALDLVIGQEKKMSRISCSSGIRTNEVSALKLKPRKLVVTPVQVLSLPLAPRPLDGGVAR